MRVSCLRATESKVSDYFARSAKHRNRKVSKNEMQTILIEHINGLENIQQLNPSGRRDIEKLYQPSDVSSSLPSFSIH